VKVALIAAIARNRVIGREGKLPWHIPDDLKRFKKLTTGHAIVMGRRTWESLGRPLPNRRNIVLSSSPVAGAEWYRSIADAFTALADQDRVFVIGGGAVFAQALAQADELYLTLVHRDVAGDAWFPPYEHLIGTSFIETRRESRGDFDFVDYVRRAA
jgi:dihydrofolate reductase